MGDVVERLRQVTGFVRFETGDRVAAAASLSEEAADLIEAQKARIEVLEKALRCYENDFCEGWCGSSNGYFEDCSGCKARAALQEE